VKLQTDAFKAERAARHQALSRERAERLEEDLLVVSVVSLPLQELLSGV